MYNEMKCTAYSRAERSSSALGAYGQLLVLSAFIDVNFGESVVCFGFFNFKIS